jgi:AraC-like DNA-binding protein
MEGDGVVHLMSDNANYRESIDQYNHVSDGMNGYFATVHLRPGMQLCVSNLSFADTFRYRAKSHQAWIELSYCLRGGMSNEIYDYYKKSDEKNNHCFLLMSKGSEGVVEYRGGERSVKVELQLDPELWSFSVRQLWHCESDEQLKAMMDLDSFHVKELPTRPSIQSILHQIVHCPYEGLHRGMFLESKALELLALAPEQWQTDFVHSGGPKHTGLNQKNRSMIFSARDILMNRMENPPTLTELAKMVSVSDWTLKEGFREVFGTTVFGFLRNYRLQQGRGFIEQGMTVSEAACAVGYNNPSYFANEFRKKYGFNPGDLK